MISTDSTPSAKSSAKSDFWDNVQTILIALVLAMVIRFVIVQPFRIPSGSMQPTLLVGDYILVTKWSYGYSRFSFDPLSFLGPEGRVLGAKPQRGDVIVFRPEPAESANKDFVKRLIGLPGDRVQMRNSELYLNGEKVTRTFVDRMPFKNERGDIDVLPRYQETLPNGVSYYTFDLVQQPSGLPPCDGVIDSSSCDPDNTVEFVVPANHYFMMGDDRDRSADSRTPLVRYVAFDRLVGKAQFVVLSFDPAETRLFLPWTWITGLRGDRFFHGIAAKGAP